MAKTVAKWKCKQCESLCLPENSHKQGKYCLLTMSTNVHIARIKSVVAPWPSG